MAFAILWKNLVFLSPSFNQSFLDFCLHKVSSIKTQFLYFSKSLIRASAFSKARGLTLFFESQNWIQEKALDFLAKTLPKTSLFHLLRSLLRAFNFSARQWLLDPTTEYPVHHAFISSLNPSYRSHIFLKRKGVLPFLTSLSSKEMGQWSETILGRAHWKTPEKWSSHSLEIRKLSNPEAAWELKPPYHVN